MCKAPAAALWGLLIFFVALLLALLTTLAWAVREYIRVRRRVGSIHVYIRTLKMNVDELFYDLLDDDRPQSGQAVNTSGGGNSALATGGTGIIVGGAWTVDQIDETRLGAAMTKTLRQAALQLYAGEASMFLPFPPKIGRCSPPTWRPTPLSGTLLVALHANCTTDTACI